MVVEATVTLFMAALSATVMVVTAAVASTVVTTATFTPMANCTNCTSGLLPTGDSGVHAASCGDNGAHADRKSDDNHRIHA